MRNIKFIKEPGYVYDLFFLFVFHFNYDYCMKDMINYNQAPADTEFFNRVLQEFGTIPNELLPFFYVNESGKAFITTMYYDPYVEEFTTTYNLSTVQTALTNYEDVVSRVIRFYFMDIDDQTLEECKSSVTAIGRLIKESSYNDALKSSLYAFFIDPVPVIQKLSDELKAKESQLAQRYEKSFRKLTERQRHFDIDTVMEKWKLYSERLCDLDGIDDIYVTFCILNKNCVKACYESKAILIFGIDYEASLEYCISRNRMPELDVFGNALSEKNRVEILELMWRKQEITIKDIEQELGFSGTNAYYHLTLMIRADMLRARNRGRTVLYSLNKRYFGVVCDMLSKYAN